MRPLRGVIVAALLLCSLAAVQGQYGGRGGYPDDDMTDRAVEYYMMQQQAEQQKYQEEMMARAQEEEMIRRQQAQYMQQQRQQEAYNRQQQQMAQEEMMEQRRQALYQQEMEEEYYRQQQAAYAQQQAMAQAQAFQEAAADVRATTYAYTPTRDEREAYQVQFDQGQEEARRKAGTGADAGGTSLDDATTLAEKGTMLMSKGNYASALVTYDRCLSVQLAHLGDMHPIVAHTVDLMGVALLRIGSAREAQEAFQKALYIYQNLQGEGQHAADTALCVMHVGQAFELEAENLDKSTKGWEKKMEDLTERAYDMYERALDVFKSRVEGDEPDLDVANIYHAMGNTHNIRGEYMEALRKYKIALSQKIRVLGEDDPSVGWTKNNIGNAFKGMFKLDEAFKWYNECLETVTQFFGPDHPEVAHVHWNLALAYHTKGEVEALKRRQTWHGRWPFRWFAGITKKRLAHEGDDFEKMDQHLHHAFNVFVQRLGEDHISTQRATEAVMAMRELVRD